MSDYDMRLIHRARIWALLCRSAYSDASGTAQAVCYDRLYERQPADVQALLGRLEAAGLVRMTPEGAVLTPAGAEATRRTLREGAVPALIMHDPAEWRQRAWQAMRVYRQFVVADIVRVADAPSRNALRRYCADLLAAGVLAPAGRVVSGSVRAPAYRLARDSGPMEPLYQTGEGRSRREADLARPWRQRALSACVRLGRGGAGFTVTEVSVAASVTYQQARLALDEFIDAGAVVRAERAKRPGDAGWHWLYALTGDLDRARDRIRPDRGTSGWRTHAYQHLASCAEPISATALATAVAEKSNESVERDTVWRFCEALERDGLAVSTVVGPERRYALRPHAPARLPERLVLKWRSRAQTDAQTGEVAL